MSSVNSSDSSNRQDEVVRRNREDYKQKESELVKKHQKEIRRLNETHYAEVEDLKEAHSGQMGEFQSKAKENLSRRDMKYQKEIENLRNLHRKQMADLSQDSQARIMNTDKTSKDGVAQAKAQFEERAQDMVLTHRQEVENKESAYRQSLEDIRQEQKETIQENRDKMNKRHEAEMKTVTQGSSTDKAELNRDFRNYRQNVESRLRRQELQHMQDKQRTSDNFMGILRNERMDAEESNKNLREGFKESLGDVHEKYDKKRQEDLKYSALSQESLRDGVHERINNKVRSLESEVRDLESRNVRNEVVRDQKAKREIQNAKDAFQANVDAHRSQKEQLVEVMNKSNQKDLDKVHEGYSNIVQGTTRQYLEQMQTQNAKNREAVLNMNNDFEARQAQTEQTADNRVKNIIESTGEENQRLNKTYKSNFDLLRQQQAEEVKALQLNHMQARAEATERLKVQMRERELQHQEKLTMLKNKYEKQMAELNDKRTVEKRSSDEALKRQAEDLKRAHQAELETQAVQFRDKVAKIQQQHSDEMKTVNNRHQEQVDQLVGAMRKS